MFNIGGGEIIVVLLLALLVLGPDKLPATAKKVGRFMHEFRRMTSGFEQEVRKAMDLESLGIDSAGLKVSDDAIHRSTEGPQLAGPTVDTSPTGGSEATDRSPGSSSTPSVGASPASKAFVADLSDRRSYDPDTPEP